VLLLLYHALLQCLLDEVREALVRMERGQLDSLDQLGRQIDVELFPRGRDATKLAC